jgi:iron complex outermembrane receptor protein
LLFVPLGLNFYGDLVTDSYAGFLEGSYQATPGLRVTAGARYTHDKKDWLNCNAAGGYTNILTNFNPNVCTGLYVPDSNSWNAVTPRVVLDKRITEDVFGYVSATKGFRSGGWNVSQPVTGPHSGVNPENVWSYEAGVKSESFARRLRVNLAAYLADYTDLQVRSVNPATDLLVLSNAATARIKGVELEVLAKPIRALQLSATISYMDARYRSFTYSLNGVTNDFSGNYLSDAPKWKGSVTADYTFTLPHGASWMPQLEYSYVSDVYFDQTNQFPFGAKAHEILNGRLRYVAAGGHWGIQLFVENATNQREPTYTFAGITPAIVAARIPPPRLFGGRVFFVL